MRHFSLCITYMITIISWFGRLGNNVIQIVNAIHYAKMKNHKRVVFPPHKMLSSTTIELNHINEVRSENVEDNFFHLKKYDIASPEPYIMKLYFQEYIRNIFKIEKSNRLNDLSTMYVHFRGGDIFSNNPHNSYVQPPLTYYKNIIKHYKKVKLICEDDSNPCIKELLKNENVEYEANSLSKDLSILSNVPNLIIGFGTFGFLLYLMNENLKNLYIPDFFVKVLPKGSWGNNVNVHIVEFPNYIKVGEWRNSIEQRRIMLEY